MTILSTAFGLSSGRGARVVGLLLAGIALNRGAEAITRAVVGRAFGTEALGLYAVTAAVIDLATVVAILGLQNAIIRAYSGTKDTIQRGVFPIALLLTVVSTALATLGLWAATAANILRAIPASSLVIVALAVLAMCWLRLSLSFVQALRLFGTKVAIEDSLFPIVRAILIVALLAVGAVSTSAIALGTAAAATTSMIAVSFWPGTGRVVRDVIREPLEWRVTRALVTFGSPLALAALADFGISQFDVLILQAVLPTKQLGEYAAAATIGRTLALLYSVATYVYAPAFAAALDQDGMPTRAVYERQVNEFRFASAVVAMIVSFLAPESLALLFGPGFADAAAPLAVLTLGFLAVNVLGFNSYHLVVAGRSTIYTTSRLVVLTFGIVLYVALVPTGGLLGAAIASTATVVLAAASAAFLSQRLLRTAPTPPWSLVYTLPVLLATLVTDQSLLFRVMGLTAALAVAQLTRWWGTVHSS